MGNPLTVYAIIVGLALLAAVLCFTSVLSSWLDWTRGHTDHRRRESARWREPWP